MIDFTEKMRKAVQDIGKYGELHAMYRPVANNLDELKKTILSSEILKCDPKLSLGEKEARARVSEAYRIHLEGIKEAEMKSMQAYAKLEEAKARFDGLRSLCSLEKKHFETFEHEPDHEV